MTIDRSFQREKEIYLEMSDIEIDIIGGAVDAAIDKLRDGYPSHHFPGDDRAMNLELAIVRYSQHQKRIK